MQVNGNFHILALVAGIAIIALFVPVFMTGGSPFSRGLDVAEFAFRYITNNTGANPEYNVTADYGSDTLQIIGGGNIAVITDYPNDRITISANVTAAPDSTTASNLGSGSGIYAYEAFDNLYFKSLSTAGDGVVLTPDSNHIQFSLNNIPKSEISLSGTWVDSDLPADVVYTGDSQTLTNKGIDADANTIQDIDDNEIRAAANIAWSKISKTGAILNDIGAPTSSYSVGSQRLTSLGTPTATTDVQRVDKLGLRSVVTSGCANGAPLEYQTSNSTWVCGVDGGGAGDITSINGDGTAAQTLAGTTGNLTVSTATGTHTFNTGYNVVVVNGAAQTITKGITANSLTLGGNANANSQRITSLGTPTATTDVQRVDKLGLQRVVTGTCVDGSPLEYQTSNNTWICGTDTDTSGITSLNSDLASSQTLYGTIGNLTVTDSGIGSLTLGLGSNVVVTTGAQTLTGKTMSGASNTFSNIPKSAISTSGTFGWTEVSKTGSSIHHLGNVTAVGCAAGQILKVSGSSWVCAADATGSGISSINVDSTPAQVFTGASGNLTITSTGPGALTFNIGTSVVTLTGVQVLTGKTIDADLNTITDIDDNEIKASANIAKSKISTSGTWLDSEIPTLPKTKISATGTFPWAEISKSGSILNDIGAPTSSYSVGSQRLTSLGTPSTSTDVQRADKLGLRSVILSGCADGSPLEYQTSNSTWICGTDTSGSGITTLNNDSALSQTISGASGNLTVTDIGVGLLELDVGSNVVVTTGAQTLTSKSLDADDNTITDIDDNEIKTAANIAWSKISKSGSILNDIGSPTSSYSIGSQRLTSLGTPSTSTDAQRVDKLGLQSVVISTCADGSPLEYQTSNSTWICGTDTSGSGITTLNNDSALSQTLYGTTGNLTITDTGIGSLTFSLGSNVVVTSGAQTLTSKSLNADSNTITNIDDNEIKASANIAKSKISTSGTWLEAEIPTLAKTKISSTGTFPWTEISKSGSILNDIGAPTSSYSVGSQRLTSYGTPTTSTDVQRADKLGLRSVILSGCSNGAPLEYQTSNSTWICGSDDTGAGITEINSDPSSSQTISGTTGNLTVTDIGVGLLELDIGSDVVTLTGVQTLTGKSMDADVNTFTDIDDNEIKTAANIAWSKISKSGSILNDIGAPTSSYSIGSQRLTSLGTPSASTDVQRVDKLGLQSVVISTCANGSPLEYQTSNNTWVCGTDATGTGILTINGDATSAQTLSGVAGNLTVTAGPAGTLTFNTGPDIVTEAGTQALTNKSVNADSNTITNIDDNEIKASANIAKSKISTTGTWLEAEIPTLSKTKISSTGTFPWAEISKTGSSVRDMDDVTNAVCANGEILKMNSTGYYACAADNAGTGGALDDVTLQGVEISNSRSNLNFNDTNVINFNVQDSAGQDAANVTATIVAGSVGDNELGTGIDTTQFGSGGVTSTEFGYIGSLTSDAQTQLNNKISTSLADGNILVGSSGGVATSVNPSGAVDISNTGVFSIPNIHSIGNVTGTGCAVGQILKVSGTTWQCAADATGAAGILTINGDSTSAQTLAGTTGNLTVTTGPAGTLTFNTGVDIVTEAGTQALTNKSIDADTNTITDIDDNEIKTAANIAWSKINKSGSILNDIGAPTSSYSIGSQRLTSLGTPSATTDVQRVDKLGLQAVVTSTCANGAPLEYQTSNSTWICGTDATGTGITDINSDSTASQVFSGTTNQITLDDSGVGTIVFNVGSDVVQIDQANTYSGSNQQNFGTNFITFGSDPADAGNIRLSNTGSIQWESDVPGTDISFSVDASEDVVVGTGANNINFNSNPLINTSIDEDGTGNSITNLADANIKSGAAIAWSKISKTGAILNDIGSPTSAYSVGSQRLTSLGTPSATSDVQRVDKLGLQSVVTSTCANGAPLEYQTSNSTWICGTDGGGANVALLDGATHSDTVAQSPTRGSIIYSDSTPKWNELVIGAANKVLHSDGTDISWQSLVEADIPTLAKSKISATGTFPWSEISKSGSILNDIGAPTSSYGFGSQRLTSLGTPSASTDAQRVDKLGLQSVVTSTCSNGAPLEYQTSNSTWICGTDATGTGITSINTDSTAAQVFSGTTNQITLDDSGVGTIVFNVGSDIVQKDTANTFVDGNLQTFTDDDIRIQDNTGGQFYTFSTGDLAADRVVSLPVLGGADVFVFEGATQTLTGKTMSGASNTFSNIPKSAISATGTFPWSEVSKSGSILNDIGAPTSSYGLGSQRLTSLGTPSATTDAQRVDKLGLQAVVTSTCANGSPLEYQTSNSTWICGTDATGTGITTINGDGTAAQTLAGTTGNLTVSTATGTHTFNTGYNVVVVNGAAQTITKGITANSLTLGGNANANSQRITSLGTPSATTDVQRVDKLGLQAVVTSTCANGAPLEYQTSNSTWICGSDADTGILTINSDSTAAQVFSGTTNQITLDDSGSGTIVFNVGSDIVQKDTANTYVDANMQTFTDDDIRIGDNTGGQFFTISTGDIAADRVINIPVLTADDTVVFANFAQTLNAKTLTGLVSSSSGADAADAGVYRLSNGESIAWESSPAANDVPISVDASEDFVFGTDANNINLNSNPLTNGVLGGNLGAGTFLITNYGAPTTSTDAQRVDKLGLRSVVTTGCANGAPLEYQTSNSTWVCGVDGGTTTIAEPKMHTFTCGSAQPQVTNTPPKSTIDGTNMDYVVCDYDATTAETLIWSYEIPDTMSAAGNIDMTVHFQVASGTAGVCWSVSFLDLNSGSTVDGTFTSVKTSCDSSTGTNALEEASITFSSAEHSIDANDLVFIKLSRAVADAGDTNTNDARMISMEMEWN